MHWGDIMSAFRWYHNWCRGYQQCIAGFPQPCRDYVPPMHWCNLLNALNTPWCTAQPPMHCTHCTQGEVSEVTKWCAKPWKSHLTPLPDIYDVCLLPDLFMVHFIYNRHHFRLNNAGEKWVKKGSLSKENATLEIVARYWEFILTLPAKEFPLIFLKDHSSWVFISRVQTEMFKRDMQKFEVKRNSQIPGLKLLRLKLSRNCHKLRLTLQYLSVVK